MLICIVDGKSIVISTQKKKEMNDTPSCMISPNDKELGGIIKKHRTLVLKSVLLKYSPKI